MLEEKLMTKRTRLLKISKMIGRTLSQESKRSNKEETEM
jgi:hypothetical protein